MLKALCSLARKRGKCRPCRHCPCCMSQLKKDTHQMLNISIERPRRVPCLAHDMMTVIGMMIAAP